MGFLIEEEYIDQVRKIAERERAPLYVVGETTGDAHFAFEQKDGVRPFDLDVSTNVWSLSQDRDDRQHREVRL